MVEPQKTSRMSGFAPVMDAGYLRITGIDRVGFLQRQTTNDITHLNNQRSILSVLTSSTARILDVLWMFLESDPDPIAALTLPGRGEKTAQFLKSRIFFMDKVTVEDASREFAQIDLYGKETLEAVMETEKPLPAAGDFITVDMNGTHGLVLAYPLSQMEKWRLVVKRGDIQNACAWLEGRGLNEIPEDRLEAGRIEAGMPGAKSELNEDHTPLEVGLLDAIADGKGCYTGQEIIARQITYDKVTRRLVGLRLEAPAAVDSDVLVGEAGEERTAGKVTSAAMSGRFGAIALTVLKRPYFEPGTAVKIQTGEVKITGTVCELPFQ
jgi:tRNA-modifying protein YgfZ